ncbi:MAG: ATP synthase F1 subunit epsilon [Lachnospiraceae bacterium]|jgi:F-type H+-transporting ATPase subunit epsilon|nr:ATP synthase F1 subunit epsilon [Lachnospiraceae bacterium]
MADEKNLFDIEIICPDRVFHTGRAYMVEFNTTEGEIGVYKNHVPITTVLSPGVVTITDGNDQKTVAAVHSGFASVLQDKVTLLAEIAEWPDEIDVQRAEAAKQRAEKRLSEHAEDLDVLRAEVALKKALVRLDIKK